MHLLAITHLQAHAGITPVRQDAFASSTRPAAGLNARHVAIATFGNVVEWFDFTLFGFLALTLAQAFFPNQSPSVALLATLGTFGAGFVARPLGAVVFGRLGDTKGRRFVLIISMLLMAVASLMIGLAPTFAQAGIIGPIILICGRMLQGVSAGAEFGNAVAYLVEWAPARRRGLFGSFHQLGAAAGLLSGAAVAGLTSAALGPAAMAEWGWRLPFIAGGVLALVALGLRLSLRETPAFVHSQTEEATPLSRRKAIVGTLQTIGVCALWTVSVFTAVVFMPTFAQRFGGYSASEALGATVVGTLVMMPFIPLAGRASDRWGPLRVLAVPAVLFLVAAVPGFALVASHVALLPVVCLFSALAGIASGAGPLAMTAIFPARHRTTWTSIGSAISATLFGGFAPLTSTALVQATGWPPAPGLYVMAMAAVTAVTLYTLFRQARGSDAADDLLGEMG